MKRRGIGAEWKSGTARKVEVDKFALVPQHAKSYNF